MNKKTYLRSLRKNLKGLDKQEIENLVGYYEELIDDGVENGKSEAEVCADLEPPERVAENYRREKGEDVSPAPSNNKKRGLSGVPILLIVIGFPIWLPLLIVAFVLVLAVAVVFIALIAVALSIGIGLMAGGIYFIVMSFGLFGGHAIIAVVQIGVGLALFGIGLLFFVGVFPWLCKAIAALCRWVYRGFRRSERKSDTRSHKGVIAVLLSGCALLIVGTVIGVAGYGALGFDYRNLAAMGEITEHSEKISLSELDTLVFESDNLALVVCKTEGEARLVYSETKDLPKEYSFENGKISLMQSNTALWKLSWNHGIFFSAIAYDINEATLYLPENYAGNLSVSTENGAVKMAEIDFGDCILITKNGAIDVENCEVASLMVETKNGAVSLKNVVSAGEVVVETGNGLIKADNLAGSSLRFIAENGAVSLTETQSESLYGETFNGAIQLAAVDAKEITLSCTNGAITGSIQGSASDYRISASTGNGTCNLQNSDSGERLLEVKTRNGAIKIRFTKD